jgi:hypothetical protein
VRRIAGHEWSIRSGRIRDAQRCVVGETAALLFLAAGMADVTLVIFAFADDIALAAVDDAALPFDRVALVVHQAMDRRRSLKESGLAVSRTHLVEPRRCFFRARHRYRRVDLPIPNSVLEHALPDDREDVGKLHEDFRGRGEYLPSWKNAIPVRDAKETRPWRIRPSSSCANSSARSFRPRCMVEDPTGLRIHSCLTRHLLNPQK